MIAPADILCAIATLAIGIRGVVGCHRLALPDNTLPPRLPGEYGQ